MELEELRDHFAGLVMQVLVGKNTPDQAIYQARLAYEIADAMMDERERLQRIRR